MFDEALLRRYLHAAMRELLKAKPGTHIDLGERSGRFILEGRAVGTYEGARIRLGLSVASVTRKTEE